MSVSVEEIWRLIHIEGHRRVACYEIILYVLQKAKKAHRLPDWLLILFPITTFY